MLNKIIRIFGLIVIIGFAAFSIGIFQFQKTIQESHLSPTLKKLLTYPSYFEDQFYDLRMNITLDKKAKENKLVLAAIDDLSLNKIGRWPWSRKSWVKIVNKLKKFHAKVLAFDVVFSEPERSCDEVSPDKLMASSFADFQSIPNNKIIIPYSLTSIYKWDDKHSFKETPGDLYNFMLDSEQSGEHGLFPRRINSTTFPIPPIVEAEVGLAYIGANEDLDGIFRRYPLVTNIETLYYPSYALLAYEYFTGDKPKLFIDNTGAAKIKFKTGQLDLNFSGESKIRWLGGSQSFPTISLYRILNAADNDQEMIHLLKDKLVFIGSTAFGAHDLRHTPVDAKLPGVYFHMNMVWMLLNGKFFESEEQSLYWSWGILILGTFLMIIISLFGHALYDVFFIMAFIGGTFLFDVYYLLPKGYQITLFFSLLSVFGTYLWNTLLNFYLASKDKKFLKSAFGNYISPELIDEMYKSGEPPKLGGVTGIITAYFTDIQGFSTFSEKLTAPQLVELLNEYLTEMTDILLGLGGTLDKYEGDAIIAFFGAPLPLEDHAIRSCKVALKMQNILVDLREKWMSEGDKWPKVVHEMRMRIGINSGEIVTGNMGSKNRMNYTMMGDSVNLAARLEEAAKQYGIFTQVSSFTKDLTNDVFEMRELDTIKVVGKSEPVTTYDLLGEKGTTDSNLMKLKDTFHQGIKLYKSQKWDEAIKTFEESLECEYTRYPELKEKANPSKIYIDRCKNFKDNPPPADWDGVYTLTKK